MNARITKFRFLLVVVLLAAPSIVFGWLFVSQSQKAITFAADEKAGIQYLRAIIPLFTDLGTSHAPGRRTSLATFDKVRAEMDLRLNSAALSEAVVSALARPQVDPEAVRYALLSLIAAVSDNSNLTIDPEIDSYYLMQTLVFQTPRVISSIDALSRIMAVDQAVPEELSQNAMSVFLETVRLEDALADMRRAYKRALAANADGSLERKLSTKMELAMRSIHQMSISGHRVRANLLDRHRNKSEDFIATDGMAEKDFVIQAWSAMGDNLERLIQQRLDSLRENRNLALWFSSIAAVFVFFIALSVFRSLIVALDEKIVFLAHHDAMTQLKNRAAFSDEMSRLVEQIQAGGGGFAIHAIDLDGFKAVNDTLGHHGGDQVLQTMASRLLGLATNGDVIGRRGGDEFVVLQNGYSVGGVNTFAQRILNAMREPLVIDGKPVSLSASVGTSIFGHHGDSEAKLMRAADIALYEAKRLGKNQACLFSGAMEAEQRRKSELEARVREAVERLEFSLAYQPQYNSDGSRITGFEALLRLNDIDGKPISPVEFIPVLESLGLIGVIGRWVMLQACKTATGSLPDVPIAVNVSPLQFAKRQLVADISAALLASGLSPERLQVEVTESAVLDDTEMVLQELNELKALGVSIAMDDFGTGYSGLSSLWKFPFDKIKIDKSFLSDRSVRGHDSLDTVGAIVDLAHALSISVTIEGVETKAQAIKMAELGCDQLQGFYFSKPIPEADLPAFVLNSFVAEIAQVRPASGFVGTITKVS